MSIPQGRTMSSIIDPRACLPISWLTLTVCLFSFASRTLCGQIQTSKSQDTAQDAAPNDEPKPEFGDDTPENAIRSYYTAMGKEDAVTMKHLLIKPQTLESWVDSQIKFIQSTRRLDAALLKKFGEEARPLIRLLPHEDAIQTLAREKITQDGDRAEWGSQNLTSIDGHWKLDMHRTAMSQEQLNEQAEVISEMADFDEVIAKDIEAGKYQTIKEVQAEMERQREDMRTRDQTSFAPDVETIYNRGEAARGKRDYEKAIHDYSEVIRADPTHFDARLGRGYCYFKTGDFTKALVDFRESVRLNPDSSDAHFVQAQCYAAQKEYEKALDSCGKAMRLKPNASAFRVLRASIYRSMSDLAKAIVDLDEAIRLDPEWSVPFFDRGDIHESSGEFEKAIEDYTKVILLDPSQFNAYKARAFCHRNQGSIRKAIDDLSICIRLQPTYSDAILGRASCYLDAGETENAISDCERVIELGTNSETGYFCLGHCYDKMGEPDKAIEAYSQAIQLDPQFIKAYESRAAAYRNRGDEDKAEADEQKVRELKR